MQPFEGLKAIDLTHVFAGPFCTYQLALLGADVIKIEERESGDYIRRRGLDSDLRRRLMEDHFLCQNANKRSLAVNLADVEGRRIVTRLVSRADIVVENFRAGTMDRLGLGYRDLRRDNPRLVYCSLTAFGGGGPMGGGDPTGRPPTIISRATACRARRQPVLRRRRLRTGLPHLRRRRVERHRRIRRRARRAGAPRGRAAVHRRSSPRNPDHEPGWRPARGDGGERFLGCSDLAFAGSGDLCFTDPGWSSVVDPTGRLFGLDGAGRLRLAGDGIAYPGGVVPDAEEGSPFLAVTHARNGIVWLIAPDGAPTRAWASHVRSVVIPEARIIGASTMETAGNPWRA